VNDKWWSVLFGMVMAACGALFVVAPIVGWWMPQGMSTHSADVDSLFYLILAITGFFFILTEALLVFFMFRYTECPLGAVCKPSFWWPIFKPLTSIFNTASKIEMAWTLVPGVILVYLAFAQVSTWADVKYKSRLQKFLDADSQIPVQVELSARQFKWRFRYPSVETWNSWKKDKDPDKAAKNWVKNPNIDDIRDVANELHVIMGRYAVVQLSTKDVIHSFNIPQMRIKQDALPGKVIPVWFKPINDPENDLLAYNVEPVKDKDGKTVRWQCRGGEDPETGKAKQPEYVWQIACAELCGWGHYRMIGRLYVHKDEADFLDWLQWAQTHQNNFGQSVSQN